jgi:hypothetical protein
MATPGVAASARTRRRGYTPPQQPQQRRPGTAAKSAGSASMRASCPSERALPSGPSGWRAVSVPGMAGDKATRAWPVSAPADALTALLAPYADPALPGRLVDVPPPVAARALELLPPDLAAVRLNLVQPPMTWLVERAPELHGGSSDRTPPGARWSWSTASRSRRRPPASWPHESPRTTPRSAPAIGAGVSHGGDLDVVDGRVADVVGPGTDLLAGPLPPGSAVVGLSWS